MYSILLVDDEKIELDMLEEMNASGLESCEEYITEQYQARMKLWNG